MSAYHTPPELARRWRVRVQQVHQWIKAGELKGDNLAVSTSGRPRWKVSPEAVEDFEASRMATPPPPRRRRRRRVVTSGAERY